MKKFLMVIALLITTICLSACDCSNNRVKHTSYTCTEYYITKNTSKINIKNNYEELELVFYSDGKFKWVGVTINNTEELYEGTYINEYVYETNEQGEQVVSGYKLTLYYDNNPTESSVYGYPTYILSLDGVLSRKQEQSTSSSWQLVEQKFEQVK